MWNFVNALHHLLLVPTCVLYVLRLVLTGGLSPSDFSLTVHHDFDTLLSICLAYKQMLSLLIFLAWVRLLKFMRAIPQVGILVRVLVVMTRDLASIALLWMLIWIGFTFTFYAIYGDRAELMSSWVTTLLSIWRSMLGDTAIFDEMANDSGGSIVGMIYYFISTILLTLFILNLIIAIMATSYENVILDAQLSYKTLHASLTMSFYIDLKASSESQPEQALTGERPRAAKKDGGMLGWRRNAQLLQALKSRKGALGLGVAFQRWNRLWKNVSRFAAPTEQLAVYLEDERLGLRKLQQKFLPQMRSPHFGSPLEKLRYLRQVFKQCEGAVPQATRWLVTHGHRMLTPTAERSMRKLRLRFASVDEAQLLALLSVFESAANVTSVLHDKRHVTMHEAGQVERARQHATGRLGLRLKDETPPEALSLMAYLRAAERADDEKLQKRRGAQKATAEMEEAEAEAEEEEEEAPE